MPDSLNDIVVLPKMNQPSEQGHTFRLLWVLDLVSDSHRSCVSLVFQNISTNFILIDTIPPELLSYCTVGSYFKNGKKIGFDKLAEHTFTIKSSAKNEFVEARNAFTDEDLDLSLKGMLVKFSDVCRQQLCFVQQEGPVKIVIPCFLIAATYYFKSTSLREAILSRHLDSLFHTCIVDENGLASIELKSAGNLGDAISIARFELAPFAKQRLNICKNYHISVGSWPFQRLKVDFPVEQEITISANGVMSDHDDGTKTFIALSFVRENSQFPFESINIYHQKNDNETEHLTKAGAAFPVSMKRSTKKMSPRQPSYGDVRHLLESSNSVENPNLSAVRQNRIAVIKSVLSEQKVSKTVYDKDKTDLSAQPPTVGEQPASKADVREKDTEKKPKYEFSIEAFIQMVIPLQSEVHVIQVKGKTVEVSIENLKWHESVVPRRSKGGYVTLRESYDHESTNLRRCAYVTFTCMGRHVCLVEIDQTNAKHIGCSTRILVSGSEINKKTAEECVQDYVDEKLLEDRRKTLAGVGIVLKTLNHPESGDDEAMKLWRCRLMKKICS